MKILISVKPKYAYRIFAGTKKYEFRKSLSRRAVDTVVVYVTRPVCRVLGEFKIGGIISGTPQKLWEQTHRDAGISKIDYDLYFDQRKIAHAIKILDPVLYPHPIELGAITGSSHPPQSFSYIHDGGEK